VLATTAVRSSGARKQSHEEVLDFPKVMLGPRGPRDETGTLLCPECHRLRSKSMHMYRNTFTPPAAEALHGTGKGEDVNREFLRGTMHASSHCSEL
jgi:hypothetical protein